MALLGASEIGKGVAIVLTHLGVEVTAIDRYEGTPVRRVAHNAMTVDMSNPEALTTVIRTSGAAIVIPEIEASAAGTLAALESTGGAQMALIACAAQLTMNREGIRRLAAEELGLVTNLYAFISPLDRLCAGAQQVGLPCMVEPVVLSSEHGQSVIRGPQDLEATWRYAAAGGRVDRGRVVVENFVCFDTEIMPLTMYWHHPGTGGAVMSFCEPIGYRQVDGDYVKSWQPQSLSPVALGRAQQVAKRMTAVLGGWGLFGVELFTCGEEILFSEVSPCPHDTGLMTLASQHLSGFELHARALLGLPVDATLCSPGAPMTIKATGESAPGRGVRFAGLDEALTQEGVDLRFFGKPEAHPGRRLGAAVAYADDVQVVRDRVWSAAQAICPSV